MTCTECNQVPAVHGDVCTRCFVELSTYAITMMDNLSELCERCGDEWHLSVHYCHQHWGIQLRHHVTGERIDLDYTDLLADAIEEADTLLVARNN